MKNLTKKELMEKYGIKHVSKGQYGEGFFDCLRNIDNQNINTFKHEHVIKRIKFAQERELPYEWLICQLNNDTKKKVGTKNNIRITLSKAKQDGGK